MTDPTGHWQPVPDYDGFYAVSDLGQVRSIRHMTAAGWRGGKLLRQFTDNDGYLRVNLSRYGKVRSFPVHVLVLRAFRGEPLPGQQGRHGSGGKTDNRLTELSWGTAQDNSDDKYRDGTMACGERQGNSRLTASAVLNIRQLYADGLPQAVLARDFSISQAHVSRIVLRQSWKHV